MSPSEQAVAPVALGGMAFLWLTLLAEPMKLLPEAPQPPPVTSRSADGPVEVAPAARPPRAVPLVRREPTFKADNHPQALLSCYIGAERRLERCRLSASSGTEGVSEKGAGSFDPSVLEAVTHKAIVAAQDYAAPQSAGAIGAEAMVRVVWKPPAEGQPLGRAYVLSIDPPEVGPGGVRMVDVAVRHPYVILECKVQPDRTLGDCEAVVENPAGGGMAEVSIRRAEAQKAKPRRPGDPEVGDTIVVPVRWRSE